MYAAKSGAVFGGVFAPQCATGDGGQVAALIIQVIAIFVLDLQARARLAQDAMHKDGGGLFTTEMYASDGSAVGVAPAVFVEHLEIVVVD